MKHLNKNTLSFAALAALVLRSAVFSACGTGAQQVTYQFLSAQ